MTLSTAPACLPRRGRGRPRRDAAPVAYDRRACAALAGVDPSTISHALNLYEDSSGAAGLRALVRRGSFVRVSAPDLLAWVAAGRPAGRWRAPDATRGAAP